MPDVDVTMDTVGQHACYLVGVTRHHTGQQRKVENTFNVQTMHLANTL